MCRARLSDHLCRDPGEEHGNGPLVWWSGQGARIAASRVASGSGCVADVPKSVSKCATSSHTEDRWFSYPQKETQHRRRCRATEANDFEQQNHDLRDASAPPARTKNYRSVEAESWCFRTVCWGVGGQGSTAQRPELLVSRSHRAGQPGRQRFLVLFGGTRKRWRPGGREGTVDRRCFSEEETSPLVVLCALTPDVEGSLWHRTTAARSDRG